MLLFGGLFATMMVATGITYLVLSGVCYIVQSLMSKSGSPVPIGGFLYGWSVVLLIPGVLLPCSGCLVGGLTFMLAP